MTAPWMKFYPSDWQSDPMLRCCSIAARGLWVEMMCLMHKAEPYGSLLVNGTRVDKRKLAILVGITEKECSALLLEIEGSGVFSRDEDGTIYSRRMRRDHIKSEEGRKQIEKRWGGLNRSPNRSRDDEPITQKLEARDQKLEKKETRARALPPDWPSDFREQFWARYPNKVGKPKALAKLELVARRAVLVPWVEIMEGLDRYIQCKPPDRPWLNPETFINQERWSDQPAKASIGNETTQSKPGSLLAAIDRELARSAAQDANFAAPANAVLSIPDRSVYRS